MVLLYLCIISHCSHINVQISDKSPAPVVKWNSEISFNGYLQWTTMKEVKLCFNLTTDYAAQCFAYRILHSRNLSQEDKLYILWEFYWNIWAYFYHLFPSIIYEKSVNYYLKKNWFIYIKSYILRLSSSRHKHGFFSYLMSETIYYLCTKQNKLPWFIMVLKMKYEIEKCIFYTNSAIKYLIKDWLCGEIFFKSKITYFLFCKLVVSCINCSSQTIYMYIPVEIAWMYV